MEDTMKKIFMVLSLIAISCLVSFPMIAADKYPSKPIQVIVPAGAGGDTDLNARIIGKYLEKELGKPVVVVNVNGAGGSLGTRKVKDADPDGYSAVFFHPSIILNKMLGLVDYSFDDFANAGIIAMDDSSVFVVNASSPYQNLQDLIAAAKAKPQTVKFATETGTITHIHALAFENATKAKLNIVDVGSASQKTVALLGKQVDVIDITYGIIKDYVASGKFRVIGVLSEKRNPLMPTVKTFKEQGVNISFPKFFYYLFPKKTSPQIVSSFSSAMKKVAQDKKLQDEMEKFMVNIKYIAPAEATKYMKSQETMYNSYKNMLMNSEVKKEGSK
jgi:tripartite-type tricarboxylate transporter receptor subunit TctC